MFNAGGAIVSEDIRDKTGSLNGARGGDMAMAEIMVSSSPFCGWFGGVCCVGFGSRFRQLLPSSWEKLKPVSLHSDPPRGRNIDIDIYEV